MTLSTPAVASVLDGLALFASLAPAERAAIEGCFEPRAVAAGEVIFSEGAPPDWLYVLTRGHVKLVKHSDDGRDVIVHLAMPGDLLGGVAAFGRRPHPSSAQAMVPAQVLRVAGADFAAIMERYPQVARRTVDELIERLTEAHDAMKSLAVERAERRIARQLAKLAARAGRPARGGVAIDVPLSRQDVADMAGTTVETAIRTLSRWRRTGLVDTVGGRLVVRDLDGLREVAESAA